MGEPQPSLEGRRFRALERAELGEVGAQTVFEYHELDGLVWARYEGGAVRLGFLVGTRERDRLEFRYSHLNTDGETASGKCSSVISRDEQDRLTLSEEWRWESKPGHGTSVVYEITAGERR